MILINKVWLIHLRIQIKSFPPQPTTCSCSHAWNLKRVGKEWTHLNISKPEARGWCHCHSPHTVHIQIPITKHWLSDWLQQTKLSFIPAYGFSRHLTPISKISSSLTLPPHHLKGIDIVAGLSIFPYIYHFSFFSFLKKFLTRSHQLEVDFLGSQIPFLEKVREGRKWKMENGPQPIFGHTWSSSW